MKCVSVYKGNGFTEAQVLPEQIVLCGNDQMKYKYECIDPTTSKVIPGREIVLTINDILDYNQETFTLRPQPLHDKPFIMVLYTQTTSQRIKELEFPLDWVTESAARREILGDATAVVQNVNKSTREFYEHHLSDRPTANIYCIDPNRSKGNVLIINNKFGGERGWERTGSEIDVRNLEELWRAVGFCVDTKHNLTGATMRSICREFARDAINVSAIILIIMSHGDSWNRVEHIYGNDKERIQREEIISFFTTGQSPHLVGIPKVFMFQACRGVQRERGQVDAAPTTVPIKITTPSRADMLIVYASQSGYVAYRSPQAGSRLINAFTKIFMREAHDKDVLTMLTMVNEEVSNMERQGGDVQMPNQEVYLRKKLYLFPGFPN